MVRVLMLFLTFLLPMQVFASGIDAQLKFAQKIHGTSAPVHLHPAQLDQRLTVLDIAGFSAYDVAGDGCCLFGEDAPEFNVHHDLSDELVPAPGFHFSLHLSTLTLPYGNDSVLEPPFLPLISPPPRA